MASACALIFSKSIPESTMLINTLYKKGKLVMKSKQNRQKNQNVFDFTGIEIQTLFYPPTQFKAKLKFKKIL